MRIRRCKHWAVVALSLVAATIANAQAPDFRGKTIIVTNPRDDRYPKIDPEIHYIYVSPVGKIFQTRKSQVGSGSEYELGKVVRHTEPDGQGGSCQFTTRATVSGQTLSLKALSGRCNGRPIQISGGEFGIEFTGDGCRALPLFSLGSSCQLVPGNALP
jgi:hypothetical protein